MLGLLVLLLLLLLLSLLALALIQRGGIPVRWFGVQGRVLGRELNTMSRGGSRMGRLGGE